MAERVIRYLKKEKVLTVSAVLAVISAFIIPPDTKYIEYIDIRVLALLYCLMVIVKGFQDVGLFDLLVKKLTAGLHNSRTLAQMLIFSCFFSGMLITNDVALITFVPFALYSLRYCKCEELSIIVVVLQTVAANLGSMATPVGNPQNLYLFSSSGMSTFAFEMTILPYVVISFVLIFLSTLFIPKKPIVPAGEITKHSMELDRKHFALYLVLFIIMILTVLRVFSYIPVFFIIVIAFLLAKRGWILLQADFGLLFTFVFLFVVVGNIGRIELISSGLSSIISGREILLGAVLSQGLSNVPAAMLLSGFTDNFKGLIVGTNIGGLGTLIASMASIISYKIYSNTKGADAGKYLAVFSLYNFVGLILLLGFSYLWGLVG